MPLSAERRRQRRAEKRHKILTCARCGEAFTAVKKNALYCSPGCRQPTHPVGGRTQTGRPVRKARRADKIVRRYLARHPELPETLAELVRAIGLTAADARLLVEIYGPYYFLMRYAQAWPKPFPLGQTSPASLSMWNNTSKALRRSLNLMVK